MISQPRVTDLRPQVGVMQRAAFDLRVSTTRQAEYDVSIPYQPKQGEAFAPHAATI